MGRLNKKLEGKVAVVLGASSGIGRAIAMLFASEGAKVVVVARRLQLLEEMAENAKKNGEVMKPYTADFSKTGMAAKAVAYAAEEYGQIDILVNCAGILDNMMVVGNMTDDMWNKVLQVNLTAPMEACRQAIQYMTVQENGGSIINVASVGGLRGAAGGAAYIASKHGLVGLTKNIAFTYANKKIRCNAVCPGGVKTPIAKSFDPSKVDELGLERMRTVSAANPRQGEPEEVAATVLFLASEDASFINGATIVADAGWCAG